MVKIFSPYLANDSEKLEEHKEKQQSALKEDLRIR
jgi:hypothetical protein